MQRYFALIALFVFSLPIGLSITGCVTNQGAYCNGVGYGPKLTDVSYIALGPQNTGVSLAWGQTGQIGSPTAYNCKGSTQSVSKYTYGSTNISLADISPTGALCGGTWNRNSQGGIADYTICSPPSGASTSAGCSSTTCGVVQVTATGAAVTSNPVNIYVHPPISSITIGSTTNYPYPTGCTSQGVTLPTPLTNYTTVTDSGGHTLPTTGTNNVVGTVTYTPVTSSVVTIDNTSDTTDTSGNPNGTATANLPGSTVINATVSQVTSAAGYFFTCPPANIALAINGSTSATITASSPQTIAATITDTNGKTLTGVTLDYASTQPQNLSVSSAGVVSTTYPSTATVTAMCQPSTCNPSPVNILGQNGNGLPITANPLSVNSSGRSSNLLWMASPQSPYFSQVDLTTGAIGSPVKLPYTPNSMVADQAGTNIYFGSYRELMVYGASGNTLSKEDTNVPGVVLAVSPDSTTVVINDQLRQVIYLYTNSSGAYTSIGGLATRAQFSPDGKNVYIIGPDSLYVHNANTGWSTYSLSNQPTFSCTLDNNRPTTVTTNNNTTSYSYDPAYDPFCGPDLTVTVPSVGTFLSGSATSARSFCANNNVNPPYFPPAADSNTSGGATDHLTATPDGKHILGANKTTLSDISYTDSSGLIVPTGPCPSVSDTNSLTFNTALTPTSLPSTISPTEIDQVVSSPDSKTAFVAYTATSASGLLPYYLPSTSSATAGTLGTIQLSSGAVDPIAGIFSPDGSIFFVSTTGDSLVHQVTVSSLTDSGTTINPKLTDDKGNAVAPKFFAVKSRSAP